MIWLEEIRHLCKECHYLRTLLIGRGIPQTQQHKITTPLRYMAFKKGELGKSYTENNNCIFNEKSVINIFWSNLATRKGKQLLSICSIDQNK